MKKMILFVFLVLLAPMSVRADDHVYKISVNIYLEENGDAFVTELWDVQADDKKKEWCKLFVNLEETRIKDVNVLMDEQLSEEGENLNNKRARYELNYISGGSQLCFGYNDTERHTFVIEYSIDDYIVNTDDNQILYHVLAENITADSFYAAMITYFRLPDDLEVRGFGYEGSSYMDAGRIVLANFDGLKEQYVAALVKFPKDTFSTTKKAEQFDTFNDALKHAESYGYEYPDYARGIFRFTFIDFIFVLLSIFVVVLLAEFIVRRVTGKGILKQKKVEKILNKIAPVFKKIVGKVEVFCKKIFGKLKELIMRVIKFIKSKIGKKKDNNM